MIYSNNKVYHKVNHQRPINNLLIKEKVVKFGANITVIECIFTGINTF